MKKHLHSIIMAFVFGSAALTAQTQEAASLNPNLNNAKFNCLTESPGLKWEEKFQELIQNYTNSLPKSPKGQGAEINAPTITIPVIFHIIHGGQAIGTTINLSQAQINSQITVLNQDFAGVGFNSGFYPASAFSGYATSAGLQALSKDGSNRVKIANCYVQFCLATKDTLGNNLATPGIERINYISKGWANPASFTSNTTFKTFIDGTVKAQTVWNVKKYLNVWVTDVNGSVGILGYATFPAISGLSGLGSGPFGTSTDDGIWVTSSCIGSSNITAGYYLTNYDMGRTATHEVGHWLGLRHIWGDQGQCGGTDYCVDTPPQMGGSATPAGCNFGSPSYPLNANTCIRPDGYNNANVTNTNGDMFMNFMDYTNDPPKYMFTWDQQTRIQTAMYNCPYRNQLGTHNLCSITATNTIANYTITSACQGVAKTPTNLTTGSPVPSYTWTANPAAGVVFTPNANAYNPSITFPTATVYTLSLASNNGVTSNFSNTVLVNPLPNIIISNPSQTVCINNTVSFTANGGTGYSWSASGGTVATATYVVVAFSTYTVTGTALGCSNTAVGTVSTKTLPTVGVTSTSSLLCTGQSVTLTATGGNTYTWQPGGAVGATQSYTPGGSTTYSVYVTDINGCSGFATKQVFVTTCAGIIQASVENDFFTVYPNPTTGKINIQLSNSKTAQLINIEVYDLIGKAVLKQSLVFPINENVNSINISALPAGSYFLKLSSLDGTTTKPLRIIKSN